MFNRLPGAMLVIGAFAPLKKGPRLLPCSLAAYPANYARVTPSFNPAQPVAELVCNTVSSPLFSRELIPQRFATCAASSDPGVTDLFNPPRAGGAAALWETLNWKRTSTFPAALVAVCNSGLAG
jgi:hypothetical protein